MLYLLSTKLPNSFSGLLLSVCFLNTFNANVLAQSNSYTEVELWGDVETTYEQVRRTIEAQTEFYRTIRLLSQPCPINVNFGSSSADLLQEAAYWEQNYGIELRGGLTSGDLDSSQIDQQGSTYLELSWDVLDNGYKEFDYRAKDLKRRAMLDELNSSLNSLADEYRCREFQIGQSFVGIEASISNAKLTLMEAVYQVEKQAYFDGDSRLDDFLISEEAIFTLRRRLELLNAKWMRNQKAFEVVNPQAFDINISQLLNAIENDPRYKDISSLERQRASVINPYQNGNRLRFFVRKEFDLLSSNRDDLVAGVRFSIPLVFKDRPNYQTKVNQLQREQNLADWERINRARIAYEAFTEQSERVVKQQYRYLRSKERMRRVLSRRLLGDELEISAVMVRLVNYIDASLELVATKTALFERANAVFLASRLELSTEFVSPLPMSIQENRARPFARSVYLWSKTFNKLTNEELLLVLKTQSFNRVFLSFSKNTDKDKLEQFLILAGEQNIAAELMISDNEWFYTRNHPKALSAIARLSLQASAIHLDIEPHTLDSYRENKRDYQSQYVELLKKIHEQQLPIKLSVALPFHWDSETYKSIAGYVDEMVIMNYENDDSDTLSRRLKRILSDAPLSKVTMALRPKDFDTPYGVEQTIETINQATGVNRFAFHKLSDLVEK